MTIHGMYDMVRETMEEDMKIIVGNRTFDSCMDDSCDGAHCSVCGGHFIDFYGASGEHVECEDFPEDFKQKVRDRVNQEWDKIYKRHEPIGSEDN